MKMKRCVLVVYSCMYIYAFCKSVNLCLNEVLGLYESAANHLLIYNMCKVCEEMEKQYVTSQEIYVPDTLADKRFDFGDRGRLPLNNIFPVLIPHFHGSMPERKKKTM